MSSAREKARQAEFKAAASSLVAAFIIECDSPTGDITTVTPPPSVTVGVPTTNCTDGTFDVDVTPAFSGLPATCLGANLTEVGADFVNGTVACP